MKYIEGYSYGRIKELTGFSDMQVKSYLQNARRNFEQWWRNGASESGLNLGYPRVPTKRVIAGAVEC